jgi:hypothetical protein
MADRIEAAKLIPKRLTTYIRIGVLWFVNTKFKKIMKEATHTRCIDSAEACNISKCIETNMICIGNANKVAIQIKKVKN